MNTRAAVPFLVLLVATALAAQENPVPKEKPVPKDSIRVTLPGCAKGYAFTTVRRTADAPGLGDFPEGMHLRMNGPKKVMDSLKAHKGSMIEITGIVRKAEGQQGISVGRGVRIAPGPGPGASVTASAVGDQQTPIDVENFRAIPGSCPR